VHEVLFELHTGLRDAGLLPVTPASLETARGMMESILETAAARYRDDLAPAIERVWEDGVASIRADLREWLRRAADDDSGFVPWRFELSFGLPGRPEQDPGSHSDPVALDAGLAVRGSIDLVERRGDALRATDYKTGKERLGPDEIVSGGAILQPVLYALALEKLFPELNVESGRLYYCTSAGRFEARAVPLDPVARESARTLAEVVGRALEEPFLPAAPAEGACAWCDYRTVCGPHEEHRTRDKPKAPLADLLRLRGLR
jgi:hypothetical protein